MAWVLPIFIPFILFFRKDSLSDSIFYTFLFWIAFVFIKDQFQPEFLKKTTEIVNRTNELFDSSKHFLYIVTPYFDAGDNRLKSIIDAQKNGYKVTLLVRQPSRELKKLSNAGCKILIHPRLHSKIYLNETKAIMGSANMLRGSLDNSLEMGIEDNSVQLHKEMLDTIKNYINDDDVEQFNPDEMKSGYCIKTKSPMLFNIKRPIQYEAYKSRDDLDGMFCHSCGKGAKTNLSKPLCQECS